MDTDRTSVELAAAPPEIAFLGVGSCEQHAAHLPLCTDSFFAARIAAESAARLGVFVLAPLPYSTSLEDQGFAGTVSLRPETLKSLVWDGNVLPFFTRPICAVIFAITLLTIVSRMKSFAYLAGQARDGIKSPMPRTGAGSGRSGRRGSG